MVAEDVVFRAIAHPVRRELLGLLARAPRSVKEMTAAFAMSQPAISQHLKELREAELVTSERVGVEQRYRLTPKPLKHVLRWAEPYRTLLDPAGHLWNLQAAGDGNSVARKVGR
ncbi:MAG TPA: metalloregulator ArsR/SmtB family transcription factor [Acidobacteriaceae bacterium]|nr:metalloregulator ArsR/SmtB family transcription factor [Acidobacteriaceae bacterium]